MMKNILGKLLLLSTLCCWHTSASGTTTTVGLYQKSGSPTRKVHRNEPFILKIGITDAPQSFTSNKLHIQGLEHFDVINHTQQISIVQGNRSVINQYELVSDEPGLYKIGPVTFTDSGVTHTSNAMTIEIAHTEAPQKSEIASDDVKAKTPTLTIELDKKNAYVGENIECLITCIYPEHDVQLKNIYTPTLTNWGIIEPIKESATHEIIDDVSYIQKTIRINLYAKEPGLQHIGQFIADFGSHDTTMQHFIAMFGFGFAGNQQHRPLRLTTPIQSVRIEPLPATTGEVQGVGTVESFTASVSHAIIPSGEGFSLFFDLIGNGNFAQSDMEKLSGMPDTCKWYPSQKQTLDHKSDTIRRRFEFIVQPMTPGTCTIPSQKFRYFDTKQKKYITKHSQPIIIEVTPSAATLPQEQDPISVQDQVHPDTAPKNEHQSVLAPLDEQGPWYPTTDRSLSLVLFAALFGMPLALLLAYLLWHHVLLHRYEKKRTIATLNKQLQNAQSTNNCGALLPLFIYLTHTTEQRPIEEFLDTRRDNTDAKKHAWHDFIHRITACAYSTHRHNNEEIQELFIHAKQWIRYIQQMR